jgi:hypothetical protein
LQLVFHPPFDKVTVCVLIGSIIGFGWGSMYYGFVHQQVRLGLFSPLNLFTGMPASLTCCFLRPQYKQGYWK